jgi:Xaa-Pro aminopeptidase
VSERAERLVELLPAAGIDLLLVTNLVNVRYLTGYTGSNGLALIGPETRIFYTDFRYVERAAVEVDPSFERRRASQDLLDAIPDALPHETVRLGFEDAHMSVRQHGRLRELLGDTAEPLAAGSLVEGLRAVKEPDEIARIRAATELADAAFRSLLEQGLAGRTEREVALSLEQQMRALGAQRPSFDAIVAAGPSGALPHVEPREVEIEPGQMVVIDWGAELDGYCSDCTRTVATGEPGEHARGIYEIVLGAQLTGLGAIKAGAHGPEVDAQARAVIESAGHSEHFGHGLGHGVGLEIHEAPRLSQRSGDDLVARNVVTVEPGIYLPGEFGVRIEDLVVVTDESCDVLTSVPKELIVTQ